MNPFVIIIPTLFIMFVFIFMNNQYSSIEIIAFLFFAAIIAFIGTQYFFGVNLTATLSNLFSKPEVDVSIVQPTESTSNTDTTSKKQTYHVQGKFDYMNAKAICKAYNGKLANIQQVTDAYSKGAEWCDYGWSEDHMALFPTQTNTWKSYQELGNKEACGRPGVNGGYNNHLMQQLGVNCFGKKPDLKGTMPPVPINQPAVDKRVQYWQSKLPSLTVSPFNYTEWSE
jgi:hypothetical protein